MLLKYGRNFLIWELIQIVWTMDKHKMMVKLCAFFCRKFLFDLFIVLYYLCA